MVTSTPSGTLTTLNLFDDSNNLVAVASGNEPDGFSSVISWTALTTGDYRLNVIDPGAAAFNFSLEIDGNTGGPLSPIASVPEPSSVSLCFLVAFGLLLGKWRTRRTYRETPCAVLDKGAAA